MDDVLRRGGMRRRGGAVIPTVFVCLSLLLAVPAAAESNLIGVWETEDAKSNVEIYPCDDAFCGRIISLKEPLDEEGNEKRDRRNEDESLHGRLIVGIELLTGFEPDGEGVWSGGRIYNPEDGKTYKCKLTLQDENTLKVRGYVGLSILGKNQYWQRLR